jgi:hypothetical protein
MAELFMDEVSRVRGCLDGIYPADEQTLSAVGVLADRLDGLKKQNPMFAGISFSPDLQRLSGRAMFTIAG